MGEEYGSGELLHFSRFYWHGNLVRIHHHARMGQDFQREEPSQVLEAGCRVEKGVMGGFSADRAENV